MCVCVCVCVCIYIPGGRACMRTRQHNFVLFLIQKLICFVDIKYNPMFYLLK